MKEILRSVCLYQIGVPMTESIPKHCWSIYKTPHYHPYPAATFFFSFNKAILPKLTLSKSVW